MATDEVPGEQMVRPPSLRDVARLAGVSDQTVSRALRNLPVVRPTTRDRVLRAVDELGYGPNRAARELRTRRTGIIGVITIGLRVFALPVLELTWAAEAAGYWVAPVDLAEPTPQAMNTAIDRLDALGIDGLVIFALAPAMFEAIPPPKPSRPVVVVTSTAQVRPGVVVNVHGPTEALKPALRHLIELGHRHLALITGPREHLFDDVQTETWQTCLTSAGLPVGEVYYGDWSATSGRLQTEKMLLTDHRPTGIVVSSDDMALGVLRALHRANVRVPQDISVVGAGDLPGSSEFTPPLTTVCFGLAELAERLVAQLDGLIEGRVVDLTPPSTEPALIVRNSTGPPPAI